jgi:calcineurin-like phosphoesterase family protein
VKFISNEIHLDKFVLSTIANGRYLGEISNMDRSFRQRFLGPWLSASKRKRAPSVPAGVRIYAIGDIHGRIDLLDPLLERIEKNLAASPIERPIHIFLGDYIDRGPASREVLQRLIEHSRTHETICLRGNHETFILRFLHDPAFLDDWRGWGGVPTLMSYGLAPSNRIDSAGLERLASALRQTMPDEHHHFLNNLPTSFVCGDYCFVHAGVRPGVPLASQEEADLLWIRDEFLNATADFGKVIVHGHTPVPEADIRANRINIDTGAYASGKLTCLIVEGENLVLI